MGELRNVRVNLFYYKLIHTVSLLVHTEKRFEDSGIKYRFFTLSQVAFTSDAIPKSP
jgi:hypothetical protein